jgi:hypothetical protein
MSPLPVPVSDIYEREYPNKDPYPVQGHSVRQFETGATRDTDVNKNDYEGFLSPLVIARFGDYMTLHRKQSDGRLRDSDNWTKGMPRRQYLKSLIRHVQDVWLIVRGWGDKASTADLEDALCAVMFNSMGMLHEKLLGRDIP